MKSEATAKQTRSYRSTRRAQQAAQTREDVLNAAVELFREHGWSGTTVSAIARQAGVAVETVYSGFGSKKALLRAAIDVAVAGDALPIPLVERPGAALLGQGTLAERLAAGARLTADVHERSAGVWRALVEAAAGDDEIERWRRELEAGRHLEHTRSLEAIAGQPVPAAVVDVVWVLMGSEAWESLTRDRRLDRDAYEQLMIDTVGRLLEPFVSG